MPRGLILTCLTLALVAPSAAVAQLGGERVKVTGIRLGLPNGPFKSDGSRTTLFKAGQWAPIYVDLECTKDTEEDLLLVVETKDADEAITEGQVPFQAMVKGDRLAGNEFGRLAYLKPGYTYASLSVRVKGAKSRKVYGESGERTFQAVDGPRFVVLGVGHNLNGLRLPSTGGGNQANQDMQQARELRGGWVETAQLSDVGLLPDQWFGYGAADLVVIGTGNREFWETLGQPAHERRRKALAEWVRRGGRAIVSVGTNPDVLEAVKEIKDILPAVPSREGKKTVSSQAYTWLLRGAEVKDPTGQIMFPDGKSPFAVVPLEARADRVHKVIVSEDANGRRPVAVQGPYGLGRITVVGFDLDRGPFTDWNKRAEFWDNLINQCGYHIPGPSEKIQDNQYNRNDDELLRALQGGLDYFEGVPVVSFGWVALFILIYIVLIGPVDYLFLKKVVKRLEWTWVTFPVIVITVSAGAYFAAYAIKGRDLKTNKVDVVDIDLAGKRIDGNTWFTLFSPRIQNYTIAVEPAGPVWTPADPTLAAHDTLMSWQGTVDRNRYGGGGGGLFSKRYRYQATDDPADPNRYLYASGLDGVPIQVWTTKAFAAQWTAPIDPNKPPISSELSISNANDRVLTGTITNNLPVEEFTDAALLWRDKAYDLGTVLPTGLPKPILFSVENQSESAAKWLTDSTKRGGPVRGTTTNRTTYGGMYGQEAGGTQGNPKFRLWATLFTDLAAPNDVTQAPNASLRYLDQSWRVREDRPEQAILVLRVATRENAQAEEMAQSPASPSRLWLGDLPTNGGTRPALQGTLKQETYIRVFIPVKPAKK